MADDGYERVGVQDLTPNTPPNGNWIVTALYDLNEDGQTDLLWQNVTGDLRVWHMSGTTLSLWTREMLIVRRRPSERARGYAR